MTRAYVSHPFHKNKSGTLWMTRRAPKDRLNRMTNLDALAAGLPRTGIRTEELAKIRGFASPNGIRFYHPPASQFEPLLHIRAAVTDILASLGCSPVEAARIAGLAESDIVAGRPAEQRPWCLDDYGDEMLCAPATAVADWLRARGGDAARIADFIARCAAISPNLPVIGGIGFPRLQALRELGDEPIAGGWAEFFCGIEGDLAWRLSPDGNHPSPAAEAWKTGMRPRVEALSAAVGVPLFHYADPDDEFDDDLAHRFLALDFVCHMIPDSPFVGYLRELTGANSVAELRAAFYDPARYRGASRHPCRDEEVETHAWPIFEWGEHGRRRIGIVTGGPSTLPTACALTMTRVDGVVRLAPYTRSEGEMLRQTAERANADWSVSYGFDEKSDEFDIDLLASIDELWVVRRPKKSGKLDLIDHRQLCLLARAEQVGLPVKWWETVSYHAGSFDRYFRIEPVQETLRRSHERALAATAGLNHLRLWLEWGSSGVWAIDAPGQKGAGRMVSYWMLDVPFDLIRRIARWHARFDETKPEETHPPEFWSALRDEQRRLAAELAAALGPHHRVECG